MPIRICEKSGCPREMHYRGYCQVHARERNRETRSANKATVYNKKRWILLRRRYLFEHPICERCGNEIASEVHHRVDLQAGGDPWAWDNLEALDKSCHSQATRAGQIGATQ